MVMRHADTRHVMRAAREAGAEAVGVAGAERLSGPPSFDPTYLLPGARAVVSVMVSYDDEVVEAYLRRQDPTAHARMQAHERALYRGLHRVAGAVARALQAHGFRTAFCEPNLDYRYKRRLAHRAAPAWLRQGLVDWLAGPDLLPGERRIKRTLAARLPEAALSGGSWHLTPTLSHRYAALAAGTGVMGWSGNVLHPQRGARVLYHSVVTDAPLSSTLQLEAELCAGCKLCTRVCQGGFVEASEATRVVVGGRTWVHNRRPHNLRCVFVCGGITGQSRYPGWSTWSEGRFELADDDRELPTQWVRLAREHLGRGTPTARALADLAHHSEHGFVLRGRARFAPTCGFCQLVCAGERRARVRAYRLVLGRGELTAR
jgi:epoxyqueuosine reductase QueG